MIAAPRASAVVAVKVLRPGIRQRFARDLRTFYAGARFVERNAPETRRLRPRRGGRDPAAQRHARDGSAARGRRLFGDGGEHRRTKPISACRRVNWELTGRDVLVTEWVDGTRLTDREAIARRRPRPEAHRRSRRAVLPAARACATASSTPTCTRGISSSTRTAGSSPSISASWAASARRSGASWPRSSTASSAATTSASPRCISRRATCRAHPLGGGFRPGAPRHRRADPRPPRQRDLHGEAARPALRGDRASSTCRRGRSWCSCRRPWWWWRAWRAGSIRSSTCGRRPSRWCGDWIERNLGAPAGRIEQAGRGLARFAGSLGELPRARGAGRASHRRLDADRARHRPHSGERRRHRRGGSPPLALGSGGAVGDRGTPGDKRVRVNAQVPRLVRSPAAGAQVPRVNELIESQCMHAMR